MVSDRTAGVDHPTFGDNTPWERREKFFWKGWCRGSGWGRRVAGVGPRVGDAAHLGSSAT